jgi:hypothetical protein
MMPESARRLFWDIDTATFAPEAFPQYTIERVLELGDEHAWRWLRGLFGAEAISAALRDSRRLSRRSANFWGLVLGVPRDQIRTLRAPSGSPG